MAVIAQSPVKSESEAPPSSKHTVMVTVTSSSDAEDAIRWGRNLAEFLRCRWILLYVSAPEEAVPAAETQLSRNLSLARELGAEIVTTAAADTVEGLLSVARERSITHVVLGKPPRRHRWLPSGDHVAARLLADSRNLQIHVVGPETGRPEPRAESSRFSPRARFQYLTVALSVALVTAAASLFTPIIGAHATALVYLLTVVALALFVNRGPALLAAALSALCWDYFFLTPVFALDIDRAEDLMLFAMYFVVALVLSQLTRRIKTQQELEHQREVHATTLYLFTRDLSDARTFSSLLAAACRRLESTFRAAATIVVTHGSATGRVGDESTEAPTVSVPLVSGAGSIGVVELRPPDHQSLSLPQSLLLEGCAQQIALALDRLRLNQLSERARLLQESERLSKTLLDSMSHELRTPISVIQSATSNLLELGHDGLTNFQREMIAEINEANERLHRLVGNTLEINRLESGPIKPALIESNVAELVNFCLTETEKRMAQHCVVARIQPNLPLVRMDVILMQQALNNLLSNAAIHTPSGTTIEVTARAEENVIVLTIADNGPGLDPAVLPRIFDKFFRAPNAPSGGVGLGLSLVKGFVEAQGGTVQATLRTGGGLEFVIRLPIRPPDERSHE